MKVAAIDIGTNTILLLIAEFQNSQLQQVICDQVTVVRLGEGLAKNNAFSSEAMLRARACFADYAQLIKQHQPDVVKAVATAGARAAENAVEFFKEIESEFRIPVSIISGEKEAELSFLGASGGDQEAVILDIGGGSTEICGLDADNKLMRVSFPFGCVKMNERFLSDPPQTAEIDNLKTFINEQLLGQKVFENFKAKNWIAVAGTATYLSAAAQNLGKFAVEKVHLSCLSQQAVDDLITRLSVMSSKDRLGIGGMDHGRADVIVAGGLILQRVMQIAQQDQITVSCQGLRYGVAQSCV